MLGTVIGLASGVGISSVIGKAAGQYRGTFGRRPVMALCETLGVMFAGLMVSGMVSEYAEEKTNDILQAFNDLCERSKNQKEEE